MNQTQRVNEGQGFQHLFRNTLQTWQRVVNFHVVVADEATELVQVLLQQFRHDEQMLLAVKEINQPQDMMFVGIATRVDVLQQLDFVERLVEEVLVVLDHLQTHQLSFIFFRRMILTLQGGRKRRRAKDILYLVSTSDDRARWMLQVLGLFKARLVRLEDDFQIEETMDTIRTLVAMLAHDFRSATFRNRIATIGNADGGRIVHSEGVFVDRHVR